MDTNLLSTIAKLRIYIGYLGEKDQFGWWQSAFFTKGSSAFLSPLFSRTQLLAQCNGVTRAAALVHDERIGVGHVYHLFRLPEDLEQGIHQTLHDPIFGSVLPEDADQRVAQDRLSDFAAGVNIVGIGPIRVGEISDLYIVDKWREVASLFIDAFQHLKEVYPYFADIQ